MVHRQRWCEIHVSREPEFPASQDCFVYEQIKSNSILHGHKQIQMITSLTSEQRNHAVYNFIQIAMFRVTSQTLSRVFVMCFGWQKARDLTFTVQSILSFFLIMPVSSCIISCTNRFQRDSGIRFLGILDKEPKRTAWVNAIRRKSWKPSRYARVCSSHFLSGQ